jgi:hypothetical protein
VTPHFETELEIHNNLIRNEHEVSFLICNKELSRCFSNPTNDQSVCSICKSKTQNGLDLIGVEKKSIFYFNQSDSYEFDGIISSLEALKSFQFNGYDIGIAVASNLISYTRNHEVDVLDHKDFIKSGIESAIKVLNGAHRILNEFKPDCVIFFNGRFLENRPMMMVCQNLGISFMTHERGSEIRKYWLNQDCLPHSLVNVKNEIIRLWDESSDNLNYRDEMGHKFFNDRRNGKTQSWVSFILNQKKNLVPINFDESKVNIGIFNSSMDEYVTITDYDNLIYLNDNDAIIQILNEFKSNNNFHFYLRVHPNLAGLDNPQNQQINIIGKEFDNLTIIKPESEIDSYALLEKCDKVITMGSTIGIEALYWGKPSILIGRAYFESIKGIKIPSTHKEVIELIKSKIISSDRNEALKFGYWSNTFGTNFKYYDPINLVEGRFNGIEIKPSFYISLKVRLLSLFNRILSFINIK